MLDCGEPAGEKPLTGGAIVGVKGGAKGESAKQASGGGRIDVEGGAVELIGSGTEDFGAELGLGLVGVGDDRVAGLKVRGGGVQSRAGGGGGLESEGGIEGLVFVKGREAGLGGIDDVLHAGGFGEKGG